MLFVSSQVKYECSVVLSCSIYQHDLSSKLMQMNEWTYTLFFFHFFSYHFKRLEETTDLQTYPWLFALEMW